MIPLDGQTYKVKTELNFDQFAHFGVKDDRNPTKKIWGYIFMDETIVGKGEIDDRDWLILCLFQYLVIFVIENDLWLGGNRLI